MKKRAHKGYFISFEGGEGCGKTSQIKRLAKWLKLNELQPVVTREPGGTALGKQIRHLVLHATKNVTPRAELFLYETDRAQHVEEVVLPALKEGKIVITDRHADSTSVYQGVSRKLDYTEQLNRIATAGLKPDLVIVLDVPVEIGLKRAKRRGSLDRLESEALAFHKAVRRGFRSLAKKNTSRYKLIDGTKSIDEISQEIQSLVKAKLARKGLWRKN